MLARNLKGSIDRESYLPADSANRRTGNAFGGAFRSGVGLLISFSFARATALINVPAGLREQSPRVRRYA